MQALKIAALLVALGAPAFAGTWEIDESHSQVGFSVRHMMVSNVRGEFAKVKGTLEVNERDLAKSKAVASIDAASINTRDAKRDEHLRTADFFDVAKHPVISFKSKTFTKQADRLKVVGDLTIRGITREVVLDSTGLAPATKDPWGNTKSGLSATTRINRKDYGLTWNKALEAGGVLVGDEVQIVLELELTQKAPDARTN